MSNTEKNKRIARNTGMLYFRMLFSMSISLYTSRVILNALGIKDFGIYNVVGGIVIMFGFLNNAMSASTQRFLTFEMGKGDFHQLNRIFSMSVTIHALIALIVLLLSETAGLWILNTQLTIPADRMQAANWVYQFSIFAFIITILYVPYNATLIAHERMNVFAYVSILEVVLKLFITFLVVWLGFEKLKLYSFLVFCVAVAIGIIYTIYCKLKFSECKYHFIWDKMLFRQMSSFANWNLLGVFAGITYNQGVNLLLNIFFGPTVNAARGIAYQILGAVNGFVTNFQVAINPPLTKSYAIGDTKYMYSLIFSASKYSFYLLFVLSLPVLLETEYILKLWLKTVPEYSVIFTRLVLIDVLICSLSGSLQTLVQASGNVKLYQLVVSGILLINLPLSFILLKTGFAPQATFVVSIIASIGALFARLTVLKRIVSFPVTKFINSVFYRVLLVSIVGSVIPYYISTLFTQSVIHFLLVLILSVLSVSCSVWLLGITQSEKKFLRVSIQKLLSK
jgi:O-antigen/teichoic acid export membrane protein